MQASVDDSNTLKKVKPSALSGKDKAMAMKWTTRIHSEAAIERGLKLEKPFIEQEEPIIRQMVEKCCDDDPLN